MSINILNRFLINPFNRNQVFLTINNAREKQVICYSERTPGYQLIVDFNESSQSYAYRTVPHSGCQEYAIAAWGFSTAEEALNKFNLCHKRPDMGLLPFVDNSLILGENPITGGKYIITLQEGSIIRFVENLRDGDSIVVFEDDDDFTWAGALYWSLLMPELKIYSAPSMIDALVCLSRKMDIRGMDKYPDGGIRWGWQWEEEEER